MGIVFLNQGVYQQSLNHLLLAHQVYEAEGMTRMMGENLNYQGLVYYNIKQPERALVHHNEALSLYKKTNDERGIAFSNGCLGRLYEKRKEYEKALLFQQKSFQFYDKAKDQSGMATILENIGSVYEDLEKYDTALTYFKKSLELTEFTHDSLLMIVNINNIGDNYRKTGNYKEAIQWTHKAADLANRLNAKYQLSSADKDLSKIYSLDGDYKKAYENLEIGRNLYQDMYTQDASKQSALFETLFEIERKNHDIITLENSQKLNTLIKIALISLLALIAMLGAVIISRQRLKIRKNNEAFEQENEIFLARNKLLQVEIENTNLNKQNLQNELETKVKSLAAHTLHIIGKNKILETIQGKLSELLKEGPSDNRKQIKSLVKMIEHNFVQDKDWVDFRQIFEQVHEDFFGKLQNHSNDLSPSETRLAALIRLNLPTKDIAIVLGISLDSLRIARYRLRKKLDLDKGQSLTGFIHSL